MKKYLICLIVIFCLCQTGKAQNIDRLLQKAANTENIERIKIGRFMMALGKTFGGVNNVPVARGIHSMEIYDLSSCDTGSKSNLYKEFSNIKDGGGYETLIYVKDKSDDVRIMIKKKKNKNIIKEMVILCMNESDPSIIRLSGKIQENDITELVNKYGK